MVKAKIFIFIGLIAAVGIVLGLVFGLQGSSDSNTKNDSPKSQNDQSKGLTEVPDKTIPTKESTPPSKTTDAPIDDSKPSEKPTEPEPERPDPEKENYELNALAIGDWGSTTDKPGSCCYEYDKVNRKQKYYKDYWSQVHIAHMLALSAGKMNPKPKVVIGHGDNFYWNGLGDHKDRDYRFNKKFEEVYDQPQLKNIPWVNVAGNHDIGGSTYICGDKDNRFRECTSIDEMINHLNRKFDLQRDYVSPNGNRWIMKDHYYKYSVKSGNVTMDIFNVDTNFADSHAARQVCCQCYGYSKGDDKKCSLTTLENPYCAGGNAAMYNACLDTIQGWWDQSVKGIIEDASKSTADWKIVNSHYSPHFHMGEPKMNTWHDILKKHKIQLFMNGHTHGENHDFADFNTHFIENGAGGGIIAETSGKPPSHLKMLKNLWISNGKYGFFELSASKEWLRVKFVTFDNQWIFTEKLIDTKRGGTQVDHCWYIPKDGSLGKEC